jgi:pyruvate,water dikinase
VLIQAFVAADVSAVAFSANPVTGSREEIVINASWGLGESIVGGTVTPDTYVIRKSDLAVVQRTVALKQRMNVPVAGGTREVEVPRFLCAAPTLEDSHVARIARLARDLDTTWGQPVDVECAYQAQHLCLLQCRPITALGAAR